MSKIILKISKDDLRKKLDIKDGLTPTKEELLSIIKPLIVIPKNGKTPTDKELLDLIKPLIPEIDTSKIALEAQKMALDELLLKIPTTEQLSENIVLKAEKVRDVLETLKDDDRLSATAIKDLPEYTEKIIKGTGASRGIYTYVGGEKKGLLNTIDFVGPTFSKVNGRETLTFNSTDELVKLNALDPTAGYLDDKIIGYGFLTAETDPVFTAWLGTFTPQNLSLGTTTKIPYMNAGGTDYLYSANFIFDGSKLTVTGDIKISNFLRYLDADTLGTSNIFQGINAGADNTTGDYNVAIGENALRYADNPLNNVAIGFNALSSSATYDPFYNVAIGYEAAKVLRGNRNIAIGYQALLRGTTSAYNICIGNQSGQNITDGQYNLNVGTTSGSALKSGYYNINFGTETGMKNIGGSYNTYIGHGAGYGTNTPTTNNQMYNTAIGASALYLIDNGGNGNTAIGYQAGNSITTGDYNVAIGYDIDVPSATASYQVNIANVIKGNYTAGSEWLGLLYDKPFYFGTGSDATIQYDGTNLVINPKVVGTGYVNIQGQTLVDDKIMFTQTDGNEYIDSLADGYLDIGATTAIRMKADTTLDANMDLNLSGTGYVDSPSYKAGGTAPVADATYPVYNDGVTSGQVTSITTKGGIITGIAVIP